MTVFINVTKAQNEICLYMNNYSGYYEGVAENMFFWAFTPCNIISIFCHLDECAAKIFRLTE